MIIIKTNYALLNSRNFDILELKDVIPIDQELANTISILNKKGYYTEMYNRARITKPFLMGAIIHNLISEKVLIVDDNNLNRIKEIIKDCDYETNMIIFKDTYFFPCLPDGYRLAGNELIYKLSCLKNTDKIELKTLVELDHEQQKSIQALEEWANKLPKIN